MASDEDVCLPSQGTMCFGESTVQTFNSPPPARGLSDHMVSTQSIQLSPLKEKGVGPHPIRLLRQKSYKIIAIWQEAADN